MSKQQPATHPHDRRPWLIPLMLAAGAFLVRLIYLFQIEAFPLFYHPTMDERYHVEMARQILAGTLPAEPYYRAPGYLYFLAGLFKITGENLFWSRVIQIAIGAATPAITYLIARKVVTRPLALTVGILAALYPTLIFFDSQLLLTGLKTLLLTSLVWQLYRTQANPVYREFIIAGVVLGLAGLIRPNILIVGPALAIWAAVELRPKFGWRGTITRYAAMGLAAVVVVAPVTIRNYAVSGDPVFIAWQGGFNFYLGNNQQATGWSATAPGIDQSWMGGYKQAIAMAEDGMGRPLARSEVSDYWYDRAWEEIHRSPGTFVSLVVKKLRLFFNGYEIPNNQDTYFARDYAWIIRPLLWSEPFRFPYGLLAPLALLGLYFTIRQWRKYFLLYLVMAAYIGSFLFFFVCDRYRQPMVPVFIILAVLAVSEIISRMRERDYRTLGILGVVLIALFIESNHDMLGLTPERTASNNQNLIGNAYLEQGNTLLAAEAFRRAVAADPTNAEALNNAGMMEAQRGNRRQAMQHFLQAIKYDPAEMGSYVNLATLHLEEGNTAAAAQILEQACLVRPYDDYMHLRLAMTYLEAGRLQEAWNSVNQSLRLNPSSGTAQQLRVQIAQALRNAAPPDGMSDRP